MPPNDCIGFERDLANTLRLFCSLSRRIYEPPHITFVCPIKEERKR